MKNFLLLLSLVCFGQIHGQIINTIAGNGTGGFSGDGGQSTLAELNYPVGVALDVAGNLYIVDQFNNRIRIVNTSGIVSTIAGNGTLGFSGDGGTATAAELNHPRVVVLDALGNLYIADMENHRIRKVNTAGIITTVAGNGQGYSGDGGQAIAAKLYYPSGIALDASGNLYIADHGNNCIRKVNTAGIITTIAGNGIQGYSGDGGQATAAKLYEPDGVALDPTGNLYIADNGNNCVRKVNTAGIISTIAGTGTGAYSGDGGQAIAAELNSPAAITIDPTGNLYITDNLNQRIRKINTAGIISTIAGNGSPGFSGDGGVATAAGLGDPTEVAFDSTGNMYIADYGDMRIRSVCTSGRSKVSSTYQSTSINTFCSNNAIVETNYKRSVTIFPNPTSDQFFIEANTNDKLIVDLYDVNDRHVFSANVNDKSNINVTTLDEGIYTLTIKTVDRVINKKLVIVR